jgi:hypothetical protein
VPPRETNVVGVHVTGRKRGGGEVIRLAATLRDGSARGKT